MSRDFRDEGEVQEFISWALRVHGRVYVRKRVPGLGLPDIDVLLEAGELVGYEVKYFPSREAIKLYEGIGEALAILLYGLDKAYLVHVFDSSLRGEVEKVCSQTRRLVDLLTIGYAYCVGRSEPRIVKEAEANLFLDDPEVRLAREKLLEVLR